LNFDFIGRTKIWLAFSATVILIGIIALFVKGLNFSIEFVGGTSFNLRLTKEASVPEVRKLLKELKLGNIIVQPIGEQGILIRTKSLTQEEQVRVIKKLDQKFGVKDSEIKMVGPGWGEYLTNRALLALGIALVGLLIYITLRFEFKMAVAAILALIHDILITVGIYALVGREVNPNTIAALLTILGYSLYDTIVVFHRIKENTTKIVKQTYGQVVNTSINQILMRSMNTSLTTLLPIVAILLMGGETLKDFAFALMVGIISGTYSTIFLASPVLTLWKETEPYYRSLKLRYGKQKPASAAKQEA
jgi:SecD/SecF fusion protein